MVMINLLLQLNNTQMKSALSSPGQQIDSDQQENNQTNQSNYQIFSENLMKMEQKPRFDKGFILCGNSKKGKTTLFLSLTGSLIRSQLRKKVSQTSRNRFSLRPVDSSERKMVNYIARSITSHPNVRMIENGKVMLVDMPGYADFEVFKRICNLYYFREMTLKIKNIHFMIVLTLVRNSLDTYQIEMLKNFMQMFPNANAFVSICINMAKQKNLIQITKTISDRLLKESEQLYNYYKDPIKQGRIHIVNQVPSNIEISQFKCPKQILSLIQNVKYIPRQTIKFGNDNFQRFREAEDAQFKKLSQFCQKSIDNIVKGIKILGNFFKKIFQVFGDKKQVKSDKLLDVFFVASLKRVKREQFQRISSNLGEIPIFEDRKQFNQLQYKYNFDTKRQYKDINHMIIIGYFIHYEIWMEIDSLNTKNFSESKSQQATKIKNAKQGFMMSIIRIKHFIQKMIKFGIFIINQMKLVDQNEKIAMGQFLYSILLDNFRKVKQLTFVFNTIVNTGIVIKSDRQVRDEMSICINGMTEIILSKMLFNQIDNIKINLEIIQNCKDFFSFKANEEILNLYEQILIPMEVHIVKAGKKLKEQKSIINQKIMVIKFVLLLQNYIEGQKMQQFICFLEQNKKQLADLPIEIKIYILNQISKVLRNQQLNYSTLLTYKNLRYNNLIKEIIKKQSIKQDEFSIKFFRDWAIYFQQQVDYEWALWCLEAAKQHIFNKIDLQSIQDEIKRIKTIKYSNFQQKIQKNNEVSSKEIVNNILTENKLSQLIALIKYQMKQSKQINKSDAGVFKKQKLLKLQVQRRNLLKCKFQLNS